MKLETNVEGSFYVTIACIDCDQCRQLAPETFSEVSGYSAVIKQPIHPTEKAKAFQALLACPTGAIHSEDKEGLREAMQDFPLLINDGVYYCGFTSHRSYGASSYLIVHPDGNWLVDAPRWHPHLVENIEKLGGINYIFLTHQDDVADAARYASHFQAERFIHEKELSAQPDAEHIMKGTEPISWHPDFRLIMAPGHTPGHMLLLYRQQFLFTGDHLAWDRDQEDLTAYRDHCWYSWTEQTRSMQRLAEETFSWILPGHGDRIHLPPLQMKEAMNRLVRRMQKQ
ncbi:MBL fold metallo-hydrolase [Ammoniphilus sp. YIM 78166]|uniref:MBL fold metallo-hydrolase n=1 Tax=Ammoniphilus sp. YIM 78166 TaxID=1644106 RepID=UPI0010700725|nr:MBL fold metallo-hydrolase [Ammoniphilus sp. YIM 78166]